MEISVILCSYNPRPEYIKRTLESLKNQTLSKDRWDLLIVDNNSNPPIQELVDISWHPKGRIVIEEKQGLTNARIRGIGETTGELIVFVDDDNVLECNYFEKGLGYLASFPLLGAWGGQLIPEYQDVEVSNRARRIWDGSLNQDLWANMPINKCAPVGAGMFVKREVAVRYENVVQNDEKRISLGRRGEDLLSAEDKDMAFCACDLGLGIGRFLGLVITHLIPAERCSDEYLDRLMRGIGYSNVILNWTRDNLSLDQSRIDIIVEYYKKLRPNRIIDRDEYFRDIGRKEALKMLRKQLLHK